MNTTHPNLKPGLLTAIAVMTLTSGIINLFWGFVASATALGTIVGVVCLPITILPTILGVFEIIYAAKLLSAQPQPVQPSPSIAIFEILTFLMGNVFSVVAGILSLIFYNDLTVKEYFAGINGSYVTPPAAPQPTAPRLESPAMPAEPVRPEPDILEEPAREKHTRKVAGKK
ncbi:MAG: hypothetical protein K8S20_02560 [Chloroflexi bacterium]|nr:hypothetical protein [Chloroflexota bacterium]